MLIDAAPALTAAAGANMAAAAPAAAVPGSTSRPPPAAATAAAPGPGSAAPATAAAGPTAGAAASGGAQAGATLQSGTGDTILQLGGNKFASVSQFKGNWMVGLREYYEKEGKWMPGKKGISLTREQYTTLVGNTEV